MQFFVFELLIPQAEERIEDAFAGAAKLRLVTAEQIQSAGIVTQGAEGKRGTGWFVYGFVLLIDGVSLFRHFEVEERCLDGPDALHAPAGGDQLLDETGLDFALRVELREIRFEQLLEVGFGFIGEDDGAAGEAVLDGVLRGAGTAFGGNRSAGPRAVGAGGFDFGSLLSKIGQGCDVGC